MSTDNFASAEHALLTGMLLGELMRNRVDAVPGIDTDGDYTDTIIVTLELPTGFKEITVKVLPPERKENDGSTTR